VFFAIYSALTEDLDNVMLPLGPSDMTLLFTSVPGEAGSNVEDVRARIQIFDTWLQNVQNAAQEASESFELVALENLRRLGHPLHPGTPETLPDADVYFPS
jgi:hypothetical protein